MRPWASRFRESTVSEELRYSFGCGSFASSATPEFVGNKAANLVRMAGAGLPMPPGFVFPTGLCRACVQAGQRLPQRTAELLLQGIEEWS
jgi:hypothetical protein